MLGESGEVGVMSGHIRAGGREGESGGGPPRIEMVALNPHRRARVHHAAIIIRCGARPSTLGTDVCATPTSHDGQGLWEGESAPHPMPRQDPDWQTHSAPENAPCQCPSRDPVADRITGDRREYPFDGRKVHLCPMSLDALVPS